MLPAATYLCYDAPVDERTQALPPAPHSWADAPVGGATART